MKSKPLPSTPGNSATLHIKTPDANGIVSYTEGSQLSKARPRSGAYLGNHHSLSFGLTSRGCWRSREANGLSRTSWASCDYSVTATPSVLLLTLVTMWLKDLGQCLTLRVWQGLYEQQREMLMGEMRGCPTGMWELPNKEYSPVRHRECGERGKNVRGTGMAQFTR